MRVMALLKRPMVLLCQFNDLNELHTFASEMLSRIIGK